MLFFHRLRRNVGFVTRNPSVLPRVIRNYFLKIFMRKKPLRTADICFDYNCNFKCKHCLTTDFVDLSRPTMSVEEIKKAVDRCLSEGAFHFNLFGGEPTLRPDLFDVIDYIHGHGALISLATNGSLLNRDYVRKLKAHKLDLALVSMDYFDGDQQDEFRGKGFFSAALAAIQNCLEEGLPVYVSAMVPKGWAEHKGFRALLDYCARSNMLLHANLPALVGRWKGRAELFCDEKDKEGARRLYRNKFVSACEMSSYGRCSCASGKEKIHVTAYGDVMPCTYIPISFGNLLEESLDIIRRRILDFDLFKKCHELCIPSTDPEYFKFYNDKIRSASLLPISHSEIHWRSYAACASEEVEAFDGHF
jgi:MoaA/NifB/PqqE/SkfB family radical SAM enzyme